MSFYETMQLFEGNHLLAISLVILGAALLSWCITVMCKSKASRDKRKGLPREVAAIMGAIVILGAGSIAFNQFLYVHDHQRQLRETLFRTVDEVSQIDSVYKSYATDRVAAYRTLLRKERYAKAKETAMTRSLRRRLMPADYDSICSDRRRWLASVSDAGVWNISTPRNLHYIVTAGQDWTEQYQRVSAIIYKGEDAQPFGMGETAFAQSEQNRQFASPHRPDSRSMAATLVCCLLILTTYLHIRRPKSWYAGHHR